jgi:hypothetical protein
MGDGSVPGLRPAKNKQGLAYMHMQTVVALLPACEYGRSGVVGGGGSHVDVYAVETRREVVHVGLAS